MAWVTLLRGDLEERNLMPRYSREGFPAVGAAMINIYVPDEFIQFLRSINLAFERRLPILARLGRSLDRQESHSAGEPFFRALADLARCPQRLLLLWNWKAAWLSIILRAPIFLAATINRGWKTALTAVLTECFFCAVSAGFYGALIQNLRDAEPQWLTIAFFTLVVPAIFQILEAYLHWVRGTPHLRIAESASIVVSAVSSLFNWYA